MAGDAEESSSDNVSKEPTRERKRVRIKKKKKKKFSLSNFLQLNGRATTVILIIIGVVFFVSLYYIITNMNTNTEDVPMQLIVE